MAGPPASGAAWIEAATHVLQGGGRTTRCPENDDDDLQVEWIPGPASGSGEYWLHCPTCGAQTFVRVNRDPPKPPHARST